MSEKTSHRKEDSEAKVIDLAALFAEAQTEPVEPQLAGAADALAETLPMGKKTGDISPNEPVVEISAEQVNGGEQDSSYGMEAYLQQRMGWTAEQAAQVLGQLVEGVEVAPGAWKRPGAKALTAAAAQWASQNPTGSEIARGFIAEMVKPDVPDEEDLALNERARQMRNETLTKAAREWISGSDPLLVAGRECLGITPETARPFEIIVVDGDSGMYDGDKAKQAQWSRALTENDKTMPPVFVYKAALPIMFLDRATVDRLQDPSHPQHYQAAKAVVHEFGHTQRDIKTSGPVGSALEERMAILVAGGQAVYPETMVYAHILNALSDKQFGSRFRDAITGAASMDEVYEIVAASAGPQAAVALAGIPVDAQNYDYELPAYATTMVRDGETGPAAVYRHLTEHADLSKLTAGLSGLDGTVAKWIMNNATVAGISLQPEVASALIACLEPDENPDLYRQHYGLPLVP